MSVYVRDLPEVIGSAWNAPERSLFLYCPDCGGSWSATRGDYWWMDDQPFTCAECETEMVLARKSCEIVEVLR